MGETADPESVPDPGIPEMGINPAAGSGFESVSRPVSEEELDPIPELAPVIPEIGLNIGGTAGLNPELEPDSVTGSDPWPESVPVPVMEPVPNDSDPVVELEPVVPEIGFKIVIGVTTGPKPEPGCELVSVPAVVSGPELDPDAEPNPVSVPKPDPVVVELEPVPRPD